MNLKEALSILKTASGKGNYPIFGPYLHSDGAEIATSSYDSYARFYFELPFKGDIEFDLIEKYLLLENVEFKSTDNFLEIKFNNTRTKLNIQHFDFPFQYKPKQDGIILNSELITAIKEAIKYSSNSTDFVYLCDKYIFSGNSQALYRYKINLTLESPIFFGREYVKVLKEECKLFAHKNINFIEYDNGFFCFVSPSKKPNIEPIVKQINNAIKGSKFISNVAPIKDGIKNIEPIFVGELEKEIRVVNENNRIKLIGESYMNGVADTLVNVETEAEFDFVVDSKILKNVSIDYDIYKPKIENRLLLKSNIKPAEILLVVEDK